MQLEKICTESNFNACLLSDGALSSVASGPARGNGYEGKYCNSYMGARRDKKLLGLVNRMRTLNIDNEMINHNGVE